MHFFAPRYVVSQAVFKTPLPGSVLGVVGYSSEHTRVLLVLKCKLEFIKKETKVFFHMDNRNFFNVKKAQLQHINKLITTWVDFRLRLIAL